ncbi:hypothetical protein CFC21_044865 [Triticum aestivum]|uniref:Uncharacterized protein n=2 Tax=Triticum aestivum TaxID=4565 RepID=A0A3B6FYY0_WHEAT|nr:hypothetical protein CFC21_044865 [Triticum aestivum]
MAGAEGLPDDLLGAIYHRCSSPYDRARFASVCRSWRAAALAWHTPLPALPLLLPSTGNGQCDRMTRAYSPEDGRVLGAPLPYFPYGKRIVGCHDGGWVAATIGCRVVVVNLFTRARLMQRDFRCRCPTAPGRTDKISLDKVVFSDDPATEGCIMAAITSKCTILLCRLDCKGANGWSTGGCGTANIPNPVDITFYNGELYGLSYAGFLHRFTIDRNKYDPYVVNWHCVQQVTTERPIGHGGTKYIFELRGNLAVAVPVSICNAQTFKVFELVACWDSTKGSYYTWVEVTNLGDHALFLGPGCCKAVHVSSMGVMHGVVQANRIYYSCPGSCVNHFATLDLGSCKVYCSGSDNLQYSDRIISKGYHYYTYGTSWQNSCTWVLPPDF